MCLKKQNGYSANIWDKFISHYFTCNLFWCEVLSVPFVIIDAQSKQLRKCSMSTYLQQYCPSVMIHVPPFWHCPGQQEFWHSMGRGARHLQSALFLLWHGVQVHKSTSHRRPVNWGGQLQTSLLVPGTHVPAMATRQVKYKMQQYCAVRHEQRNFTATWVIKVYPHSILSISVRKLVNFKGICGKGFELLFSCIYRNASLLFLTVCMTASVV